MKIAFFEKERWPVDLLKKKLDGHDIEFFDDTIEKAIFSKHEDIDIVGVFHASDVSKDVVDNLLNLKLVVTMSTGFDHIDVEYCKGKGIVVCNVPTYGSNTVAEHTFALIMALSRKLYSSIKRTREAHTFKTDDSLRGFDLMGKTLGLVGCGNIGKNVARIAVGFGMNVLVYDPNKDEELAKNIGFQYVDFNSILENSDIISLHIPFNTKTKHILNEKTINNMKDGVYIINTSRGGLIDTYALVAAIKNGKVAGAGLDVLEEETEFKEEIELLQDLDLCSEKCRLLLEDLVLMKMNNVIITPHNGFNSDEAHKRIVNTTINNILSFVSGKPKNCVNGNYN